MRVAFYAPLKHKDHPLPSGDREIARSLYRAMQERGYELTVISKFQSLWFFRSALGVLRAGFHLVQGFFKVIAFRPDAFFTYHAYYKAPDIIAPVLARLLRKPYFVLEAKYGRMQSKSRDTYWGWRLNRWGLLRASHVFYNISDDRPGLASLLPAEKLTYIPPSVDLPAYRYSPEREARFRRNQDLRDEVVIAGVAMLRADRKGPGVAFLLACLKRLVDRGIAFRYFHAGEGEERARLEELARELGIHDRVRFLGQQGPEQVAELLSAADFFAFPGFDEGFGLVYVEAQASGCPVVAFKNGGIPDAVDENASGFLTPVWDHEAYTEALARLATDVASRERMGANAVRFVSEKFDRAANYRRMTDIMERISGINHS